MSLENAELSVQVRKKVSRRGFLRAIALGSSAVASGAVLGSRPTNGAQPKAGPATRNIPLNRDWLFGGKLTEAALQPDFSDDAFQKVTVPHCVSTLSWQNWDAAAWEDRWIYRRHLELDRELRDMRLFLEFDGVNVGATPVINGHSLPEHLGGYLPFKYEITPFVRWGRDVLAVAVDSRWLNVPPAGSPKGNKAVDYYMPGGITRSVMLRAVPTIFISDVFAKPVAVLQPDRRVDVLCTIDAAAVPDKAVRIQVDLLDGGRTLATATQPLEVVKPGETEVKVTLSSLGSVALWDIATPKLYDVKATLLLDNAPLHDYRVRIGFREARFEVDGFFFNGRRLQIFGLDRHELYPYVGSAMPGRVMRHDARMLKREFNCNMVRCSHYPQTEAFLEACDELGLMVWEELPGWQYIGDDAWQDLAVRDVQDMIRRDRNHAAIVIWGVRINESENNVPLYTRTTQAAKALDDSRQTSGAMNRYSTKDWHQDVYAFDDYHAEPDGSVGVRDPLAGVPYFLAEGVGQFAYGASKPGFGRKYRRAGDVDTQQRQALAHAQIHSKAAANPKIGGAIAWCAFDYGSPVNSFQGMKCPGVADIFRVPKLGAAFYRTQGDPKERVVIEPNFYWDFGPQSPNGPGEKAVIFSNCDRLELFIDSRHHSSLKPDTAGFPNLKHPPFFAQLKLAGMKNPELRIDGYVGDKKVLSRWFSSDTSKDQLLLEADDAKLVADGSDATRLMFRAADKFGALRPFVGGEVALKVEGPAIIVGDNPFSLVDSGGVGAVWIKTVRGRTGVVRIVGSHLLLGSRSVKVVVLKA